MTQKLFGRGEQTNRPCRGKEEMETCPRAPEYVKELGNHDSHLVNVRDNTASMLHILGIEIGLSETMGLVLNF